jgi:hypothetical protein
MAPSTPARAPSAGNQRAKRASPAALIAGLPASFSEEQRERIGHLVADLNNAPLRVRLTQALDEDCVPIAGGEVDLVGTCAISATTSSAGGRASCPPPRTSTTRRASSRSMLVYRAVKKAGGVCAGESHPRDG